MENDSIRASGTNTLIDIWIEGKMRSVCITREAIEALAGFPTAGGDSEEARCDFVRRHLPQVAASAKARLRGNGTATSIVIGAGQLVADGDRRKNDRRSGDRRKAVSAPESLPTGERRQRTRRAGDRRRKRDHGTNA